MHKFRLLFLVLLVVSGCQLKFLGTTDTEMPEDEKALHNHPITFEGHLLPYSQYIIELPSSRLIYPVYDSSEVSVRIVPFIDDKKLAKINFLSLGKRQVDFKSEDLVLAKLKGKVVAPKLSLALTISGRTVRSGATISRSEILRGVTLSCEMVNLDVDVKFLVKSFEVAYVDGEALKRLKFSSPRFNLENSLGLTLKSQSSIITFTNVLVQNFSGSEYYASPMFLHCIE